jgi:hypothetical protein
MRSAREALHNRMAVLLCGREGGQEGKAGVRARGVKPKVAWKWATDRQLFGKFSFAPEVVRQWQAGRARVSPTGSLRM